MLLAEDPISCFRCVQITQLVNRIIYQNIYSVPAGGGEDAGTEPRGSLREGVLLLHRGGLASFRWVK